MFLSPNNFITLPVVPFDATGPYLVTIQEATKSTITTTLINSSVLNDEH